MIEDIIRINSDKFIETWNEFSNALTTNTVDWSSSYEDNTLWSKFFLGGKKSSTNNSPIGNYFSKQFDGLRYRTEDGSFDLAFTFAKNFSNIPYIDKNEIDHFEIGEQQFYPSSYDIIVEIENGCNYAWHEMTKLTWIRCPLKVLVTYKNKWDKENEMLVESFTRIISQSNKNFKDNQNTEYLLLVGNKSIDNTLNWVHYKFNSSGEEIGIT